MKISKHQKNPNDPKQYSWIIMVGVIAIIIVFSVSVLYLNYRETSPLKTPVNSTGSIAAPNQ